MKEKKIVVCGLNRMTERDKEAECSDCGGKIFMTEEWEGDHKFVCRKCFMEKYLDMVLEGEGEMVIRPETVREVADYFDMTEKEVLVGVFEMMKKERFGEEREVRAG